MFINGVSIVTSHTQWSLVTFFFVQCCIYKYFVALITNGSWIALALGLCSVCLGWYALILLTNSQNPPVKSKHTTPTISN